MIVSISNYSVLDHKLGQVAFQYLAISSYLYRPSSPIMKQALCSAWSKGLLCFPVLEEFLLSNIKDSRCTGSWI